MTIRFALARALALASVLVPAALPAAAADFDGAPRRPRGGPYPPPVALRPCPSPAYVTRAPTNAPDDPTYVGSAFGLGKPSYYGTVPPPGVDDPYGRLPRIC